MARLALRAAAGRPEDPRMPELRAWAHRRLRPTDPGAWAAGADSRSMWALPMAAVPADDEQLNWLAQSSGVDASDLRALVPGRASVEE